MSHLSFVVLIDVQSIKKFVFGTDALSEVRGASALLDWLNQEEMERCLCEHPGMDQAQVETVYANGGSAQFLVHGGDEPTIRAACTALTKHVREQTGGEVRIVHGVAPFQDGAEYRKAMDMAHFQLRGQREFASGHFSTALMPAVMECQSASHLPAEHGLDEGSGPEMLSAASYHKRQFGRSALEHDRGRGPWSGWMRHLAAGGPWPKRDHSHHLRCQSITDIGARSDWRNYVGVVYADGNAMGQVVQAIEGPETSRQFSAIVDESIRQACFTALSEVCRNEIESVREAVKRDSDVNPLPADILLLGGDDLLVALPADRALDFTMRIADLFEHFTRERVAKLQDPEVREFFHAQLGSDTGFTISCGVAVVKSTYPFYLARDLAEQLMDNAKQAGSRLDGTNPDSARIDFHVVTGANSHVLDQVRRDDYRVDTRAARTLRPLSRDQLKALQVSVQKLRQVRFPRSKLHELQEAALVDSEQQASRRIKDIFGRCRSATRDGSERTALWQAVHNLAPPEASVRFPWFVQGDTQWLCVADIMEAYELFPSR